MNPPDRKLAPAFAVLAAVCLEACASVHPAAHAAAMPVFGMDQVHPAVAQAVGSVKSFACLGLMDETAATVEALDSLRDHAGAKGATALIDYQAQVVAGAPRAPQCARIVAAEAVAVVLGPRPVQAAAGRAGPG